MRCGYPASSIRGRIYVEDGHFGFLLYTGTPDAMAPSAAWCSRPGTSRITSRTRYAALCSNDPICAQHVPDSDMEKRWLHGAACHGCVLIAETSCEDAQRPSGPGPGGTDPGARRRRESEPPGDDPLRRRETMLLDRMQEIGEAARHRPDTKVRRLIDWIREHQCPGLPRLGETPDGPAPRWNDRRVLIFTENRQGTKRYLRDLLEQAIEGTDRAEERIAVIDGLTSGARRKAIIQRRFNEDPAKAPCASCWPPTTHSG